MSAESHTSTIDLQQRLQNEQVLMFCRLSRVALIASVFGGLFVCYVLLVDYPLYQVLAWLTLFLVTVGVRFYQQNLILSGRVAIDHRVVKRLLVVIGINGLAWSLPSTLLIPRAPTEQVILSLFIVGVSANSLTSLTPLRHAYTVFVVTMMGPIAALYFWLGDNYATSAIGIVAYLVFMIMGGKRQAQGTEHLIRLQLENAALAENVQREKEVVERANRDLQLQIEQRERTEAELRAAKNQAETANRTKSQFLANMSHELRTPLNGVLGMSELLLRALGNTPALHKPIKYAHTIRTSGERLLHLITDILDMARIEAGALRFDVAPLLPQRIIAEVVELTAEQCGSKSLVLTTAIDPDVPQRVLGDENRIRQILTNLVANAIKFTDRGAIAIKLSVAATPDVGSGENKLQLVRLRWSVIDSGIGISDDAKNKLFQPFSQVDDSYTRKFGGTGLGLAICQELVRALGGQIGVQTQAGQGSTFWFELPFAVAPEIPHTDNPAALPMVISMSGHVLIAEDNITNAQLVGEMLELAGCKVSVASNGIEAVAKLKQEPFDLVLMDWHMPEMDGVAATRAWRDYERLHASKRAPIIALTASVLPGDRETCLQAGMDDFIAKPFTYDELIGKVKLWLTAANAAVSDS